MATDATILGQDLPLKIADDSSVLIIQNLTTNSASFVTDVIETTTKQTGSYKEYKAVRNDVTFGFEGFYSVTANAQAATFADMLGWKEAGTTINWEVGTGVASTPKWSGTGIITSLEITAQDGENVTFSGEIQNTGDITVGTYSS